jgi:hypothetical protein
MSVQAALLRVFLANLSRMRLSFILILLVAFGSVRADGPRSWTFDTQSTKSHPPQGSDQQQIYALITTMVDRWNAHDIDGYMETLWKSPDFLYVVDGEEILGWGNLLAAYKRGYPDTSAMGTVTEERCMIQPLTQDLALVLDWWTATFPSSQHKICATTTYNVRRFASPDGWKVVAFHTSFIEP